MGAPEHPPGPLAPLEAHRQWLIAVKVPKADNKTDKLPFQATGQPASVSDPATWTDYETAARTAAAWGVGAGLGFVLTKADRFVVIDIDDALQADGTWSRVALDICASLPGAVVEVSQSGRGLHVWARCAAVPPHACKVTVDGQRLECYSSDRFIMLGSSANGTMADDCSGIVDVIGRYFPARTAVAAATNDGPYPSWRGPADDDELLAIAMRSRGAGSVFGDGVTFAELWNADADALGRRWPASGRPYDASSADAALASRLAFFTGRDASRIERLMRRSGLVRDKWDRPDYLLRTIAYACGQQRDVYREHETLPAPTISGSAVVPADSSLTFAAAAEGWIDARLETVFDALQSAESGISIRLDRFLEQPVISRTGEAARPFKDVDYGRIRAEFGRRGFKPVAAEIARTAVAMAADQNAFDSAHDYVKSLRWDGVARIDTALPTYFRTADTPYTRAVGAYLFTALAGRALRPGVQVDMVPVLVGLQGKRKSSAVRALCPLPEFFTEVNLKKLDDDNTARLIRGKLVGELAELRGLFGRDQESIKAWITRRDERWRSLWNEFMTTYPRRIVFVGTTNEREFLDDPSGERRWLPVVAGLVDVEAIERDREQLWAEGATRFEASGVAWQDAERLARAEHEAFKLRDPWHEPIEAWLDQPFGPGGAPRGLTPFRRADVVMGALHRADPSLTPAEEKRLAKVLGLLGYESTTARFDGKVRRVWARKVPPAPTV